MKICAIALVLCIAFAASGDPEKVTATVGEKLVFEISTTKDDSKSGLFEWIQLENVMGRTPEIFELTSENMKINADGTKTFTFGYTMKKAGSDTLTFVFGNVSKVDDAIANFNKNEESSFNVEDMDSQAFSQVTITVEEKK